MGNKDNIEQLIFNYLSNKSTPDDNLQLESWIQESPDNLKYYREIRNIWQVANPAFNPDRINVETAHNKVMRKVKQQNHYKNLFRYWQRIAAILLIPYILFSAYFYFNKDKAYPERTFQEIFSPYGTHSRVNLPDGSTVWLNAGSSLKFPTVFVPGEREVFLNGEGYFEVKSDEKNPFWVHMEKLKVRATGTRFNIEAYKIDSLVAVTLVEGTIDVTVENKKPFDLLPGERLGFNRHTSECKIIKTDPYKWYAWKDGAMVFRDDPLSYVFERIGKTFNVNMELNDPEIASFPYRATFKEESLDEILRLLKLSVPIDYKKAKRTITKDGQYAKQTIEIVKSQRKNIK